MSRTGFEAGLNVGLWLGSGLIVAAELLGYFASFVIH